MANAFQQYKSASSRNRGKANEAIRKALRTQGNSGWDMAQRFIPGHDQPKVLREVVAEAINQTRALLATFDFPQPPQIEYQRINATKTANIKGRECVDDGVILLKVAFTTLSGVRKAVDVPVEIREGMVVQPSVFLDNGTMQIISPSAVNDMVKAGTFHQQSFPRTEFSPPLTRQEAHAWNGIEKKLMRQPRMNPGMFTLQSSKQLLRAAVRGDAAFRTAQSEAENPHAVEHHVCRCPECDSSNILTDYNDDQAECKNCGHVAGCESFMKEAQVNPRAQPAREALKFKSSEPTTKGDRIWLEITWDPEQTEDMSDGNIKQQIRSYVLQRANNKELRDLGTIAANHIIEELDIPGGKAVVSFKSSEVASPQNSSAKVEGRKTAKAEPIEPSEIKPGMDILIDELGMGKYWTPLHVTAIEPYGSSWILNNGETIVDDQSLICKDASKVAQQMDEIQQDVGKTYYDSITGNPVFVVSTGSNLGNPAVSVYGPSGMQHFSLDGFKTRFQKEPPPYAKAGFKQASLEVAAAYAVYAATGPSNDDYIDPAERDRSDDLRVGEDVKLEKGQVVRTRGGGTQVLEKGSKGKIVGDVYGDAVSLKVKFDAGEFVIPKQHLKSAQNLQPMQEQAEMTETAGGPGSGRKKGPSSGPKPSQFDKHDAWLAKHKETAKPATHGMDPSEVAQIYNKTHPNPLAFYEKHFPLGSSITYHPQGIDRPTNGGGNVIGHTEQGPITSHWNDSRNSSGPAEAHFPGVNLYRTNQSGSIGSGGITHDHYRQQNAPESGTWGLAKSPEDLMTRFGLDHIGQAGPHPNISKAKSSIGGTGLGGAKPPASTPSTPQASKTAGIVESWKNLSTRTAASFKCPECFKTGQTNQMNLVPNQALSTQPDDREYECERCGHKEDALELKKMSYENVPMPEPDEPEDFANDWKPRIGSDINKIIAEIKKLKADNYANIDVILATRKRYGSAGEEALKSAKAQGLLK